MVGFKRCIICRRKGHYVRDCPTVRRTDPQTHQAERFQSRGGARPQVSGCVYASTRSEAASSGNLIIGCCLLFGKPCCVLLDSRETHSFIPEACVEKMGLSIGELQFDLVVSTPASGLVRISTVCDKCPVVVEGHCGEKKLLFHEEEVSVLLSSGQVWQELNGVSCCFLVLTHMEVEQCGQSLDHSLVSDFLDVYPKEVPWLPP
ncbi:uncharacterized protein LOC108339293 [Vigna angularis]|uniref:uncharacterized protein LOC108339293 n=1 Tax=Phaseolus angularis TaxID=3914 RepID=UPI000809E0C2|nr:uncharacterized protein LOC108339293 [Vigna angularis]